MVERVSSEVIVNSSTPEVSKPLKALDATATDLAEKTLDVRSWIVKGTVVHHQYQEVNAYFKV